MLNKIIIELGQKMDAIDKELDYLNDLLYSEKNIDKNEIEEKIQILEEKHKNIYREWKEYIKKKWSK